MALKSRSRPAATKRLTEAHIVTELERHPEGLPAMELVAKFDDDMSQTVRRVVHAAIDRGTIEVGPSLNLYKAKG